MEVLDCTTALGGAAKAVYANKYFQKIVERLKEKTMPSKSKAQHGLMEAAAHGAKFPMAAKIPTKVAKEFSKADKGKKFGKGGPTKPAKLNRKPQGR